MKKIILIISLIAMQLTVLLSQKTIPIYRKGHQTIFIDNSGSELFKLPINHNPLFVYPSDPDDAVQIRSSHFINYNLDIFNCGLTTIRTNTDSLYWIDEKGNLIKEFGTKYSKIIPAGDDLFLAKEPIKDKYDKFMFTFLNLKGVNIFGNKKYWNASVFSENLAAVQVEESGEWVYINKQGEIILHLDKYPKSKIKKAHKFSNGLAKIEFFSDNSNYYVDNYIFIDKNGNEILNLKELFKDKKIFSVSNYNKYVKVLFNTKSRKKDVLFIDKKGNKIIKLENINSCSNFKNNFALVKEQIKNDQRRSDSKSYLIDEKGNKIKIDTISTLKFIKIKNYSKLLHIEAKDSTNAYDCLYDLYKHKKIFRTTKMILAVSDSLILTYNVNKENLFLYDYSGNLIWKIKPEEEIFISLEEALKYQNLAKHLIIKNEKDFSEEIFRLKNIEDLTFISLDIDSLYEKIEKLKKLKKLTLINLKNIKSLPTNIWELDSLEVIKLYYLDSLEYLPEKISNNSKLKYIEFINLPLLKELPKEFGNLNNLKTLKIFNCKSLNSGIENVLEKAPALKRVSISGVKVDKEFIEKIKKIKPNLRITKF